MGDGWRFLERAEGVGPTQALRESISAGILAFGAGLAGLIATMFDALGRIREVFDAAWTFMAALLMEPIIILEYGARASAIATQDFGLFGFAVGVGAIIAGFWLWEASGLGIPIVSDLLPWNR